MIALCLALGCLISNGLTTYATNAPCGNETFLKYHTEMEDITKQLSYVMETTYCDRVENNKGSEERALIAIMPARIKKLTDEIDNYKEANTLTACEEERLMILQTYVVILNLLYSKVKAYVEAVDPLDQYVALKAYIAGNILLQQMLIDFIAIETPST